MQKYEVMILYKPLLLEDIKKNTTSEIEKFVSSKGGSIKEVDNLGKRLLAYPIKKFEEGHYIEYTMEIEPSHIKELERELSLLDNVLRFLVIKK
ncbi:30S ribosomal protein S6 [Candidatus Dojkabacteria bacterium]|uniref:Small ribosomal subunit protein bS6 n=1 Tax=Candidatus Dojkabacteria bacterium TaxID=2099670 RepID=A0A955IBF0_9BACT|nr:30S ribosomal protein S6 [Candidatus Dojkabacteria bacterium]